MTYDDGKGVSAPPKDWKNYLGDLLTNNQILDVIEDALRIKADVEYKAGNVSKLKELNQLIREIQFIRGKL